MNYKEILEGIISPKIIQQTQLFLKFFYWKMSSSKFWSAIISPDKPCQIQVPEDKILMISNACLSEYSEENKNEPTRIVVTKHETPTPEDPIIIATLIPEKKEHCVLEFKFTVEFPCTISVRGKGTIHLVGFYINLNDEIAEEENAVETGDAPEVPLPNPSEIH